MKNPTEDQEESPTLSVVLPTYNNEQYIDDCVNSIINQTFKSFELIIIDGGSSDQTIDIIQNYNDSRIHLVVNKRRHGRSAARNQGLQKAQSEFIVFHDADDLSHPDRFLEQLKVFDENEDIVMVCASTQIIDKDGTHTPCKKWLPPRNMDIEYIWRNGQPAHHAACMFRTSVIEKLGGYRLEFERGEDLDLWYRLVEKYGPDNWTFINKSLYYYRIYPENSGHELYHKYAYKAAKMRQLGRDDNPILNYLSSSNISAQSRPISAKMHSYYLRLGTHAAEAGKTSTSVYYLMKSIRANPKLVKPYIMIIFSLSPSWLRPVLSSLYRSFTNR